MTDGTPPPSRVVGEDWSVEDLSGRTETAVEYVRVDLAETTSTGGLVFEGCTFRDVGFELARHTAAAFVNCTFVSCRFTNATLQDCKFIGSSFERCEFARMTVEGGDWSFVALRRADLRTATFVDVRMREIDLSNVDARGGVLRGCEASAAAWHEAQLERCDLRGTDLHTLNPWGVRLAGARVTWEQAVVIAIGLGLDVTSD